VGNTGFKRKVWDVELCDVAGNNGAAIRQGDGDARIGRSGIYMGNVGAQIMSGASGIGNGNGGEMRRGGSYCRSVGVN
jgi:hypothetical protein